MKTWPLLANKKICNKTYVKANKENKEVERSVTITIKDKIIDPINGAENNKE